MLSSTLAMLFALLFGSLRTQPEGRNPIWARILPLRLPLTRLADIVRFRTRNHRFYGCSGRCFHFLSRFQRAQSKGGGCLRACFQAKRRPFSHPALVN
jgi:hypothetical protein